MSARVLVVTGTGTGVGKTVATAAIAALASARGESVTVIKPVQTGAGPGDPGDVDDVRRLAGPHVRTLELARYPDPLAPATAARLRGRAPLNIASAAAAAAEAALSADLVLIEGAGGSLVRFDASGSTIADLASTLGCPVLVVASPRLGTLNHIALTVEALGTRGLTCAGVIFGSWPAEPDLACRCNVTDVQELIGQALGGALPEGMGALPEHDFRAAALAGLAADWGGHWRSAPGTADSRSGP